MNVFFKNREYRYITISDCLSVIGDSFFYIVMITYANLLDNSTLAISLLTISEVLPDFLSVFTGYFVDKTKNKAYADIFTNFIRAILFIIVSFLFFSKPSFLVVVIVSIINLFSDTIGIYSDNLRFPIIYAIIPEEDMEESLAFSNITYYIFDFLSKAVGGVLLLILSNNYVLISGINSLTFIIAGVMMVKVAPGILGKLNDYEVENLECNEDSTNFIENLRLFLKDKTLLSVLVPLALNNALVNCLYPIIYIMLDQSFISSNYSYSVNLSILTSIAVAGIVLGNYLSDKIFKNKNVLELISLSYVVIMLQLFFIFTSQSIILIYIFSLVIYIFEGTISPKFTLFIMDYQEYKDLGMSIGLINTFIASVLPIQLSFIMFVVNAQGIMHGLIVIALSSIIYMILSIIMLKRRK